MTNAATIAGFFSLVRLLKRLVDGRARLRRHRAEHQRLRHFVRIAAETRHIHLHALHVILAPAASRNSCARAAPRNSPSRRSDSNSQSVPACDTAARRAGPPGWRAPSASMTLASSARAALATISNGVFTLARYAPCDQNSCESSMVLITSRMSPSVARNVLAMRSTSASGGLSATKRCASSSEI